MKGARVVPFSSRSQPWRRLRQSRFAFAPPIFLLAATAFASGPLPPDVERFIERREVCEHFRGEPWPEGRTREDEERRSLIARELKKHCAGSDAQLGALRHKYHDEKTVIRKLERYEDAIEAR